MKRAAVVALALVAGCASEENFRKAADTTVGQTEAALVLRLGTPDQIYDAPANASEPAARIITYRRANTDTIPGYYQCVRGFCWVTPPQTFVYACTLTFRIQAGVVRSYNYSGNGCRL